MSIKQFQEFRTALEEFTEEVTAEVNEPTEELSLEPMAESDEQSEAIDEDVESLNASAKALEDIAAMVEEAPGASDEPLEPFVQKAATVALESADLQIGYDKKDTKEGFVGKAKAVAAKIIEAILEMGRRIVEWIKGVWARVTDRVTKNAAFAKKLMSKEANYNATPGAKITDKALLAAMAGGREVGEVMMDVVAHATQQANKGAPALASAAKKLIAQFARAKFQDEREISYDQITSAITASAGTFAGGPAPAAIRSAVKAGTTAQVLVSEAFFAGYRAWVVAPASGDTLQEWNHGLSKVEDVSPAASVNVPDPQEIRSICEYVVSAGELVAKYRASLKDIESLEGDLKALRAKVKTDLPEAAAKELRLMSALLPKIIKGPQVAAYNYAATAGSIALRYCASGMKAKAPKEEKAKA